MNKKTYLLLFFIPLTACLCHIYNVLSPKAENIFGWAFSLLGTATNIIIYGGWIYYCLINYSFFKSSLLKAFLFCVLGMSLWWGIDIALYFTVGYVDNIGTFLMKWIAIYNYVAVGIFWAIVVCRQRYMRK